MELLDHLHVVQTQRPALISKEVKVYEEFGISRSFHQGATTKAQNRGMSESDINAMNRWCNIENVKDRHPEPKMQDHYSDISMMIPTLLRLLLAL
jgi:hypothetical protein